MLVNNSGPYYVVPGVQGGLVNSPVNQNVLDTDPPAPQFNVANKVTSTETYWLFLAGKLP
jgi:hypothetical protein